MPRDKYVAIDFGTTNTVAVVFSPGSEPQRVKFGNDWRLPSAVFWTEEGPRVGGNAERSERLDPTRFCRSPKREMGYPSLWLGDQLVPVVDVVAAVLGAVRIETERQLGGSIPAVVLTWPVQWAAERRKMFQAAAQVAGFDSAEFLEEPVAAAIRLGPLARVPPGKPFAVLDFGGGTLDVAILERRDSTFEVLGIDGADPLGGEDLDDLLFGHVVHQLSGRIDSEAFLHSPEWYGHRVDVRKNCRQAKEDLSEIDRASIWVPPISQDVLLTRQDFETLTENVLNSTVDRLASAIDQSGSERFQVPVLLAGGSSRIPALHQLINRRLGCPVTLCGDPQFVVSEGAGMWLAQKTPASTTFTFTERAATARQEFTQRAATAQRELSERTAKARQELSQRAAATQRELSERTARVRQELGERAAAAQRDLSERTAKARQELSQRAIKTGGAVWLLILMASVVVILVIVAIAAP